MEFWGVEVKSGQSFDVTLGEDKVLHLSQACLGEIKKDKPTESICLRINIEGKKLVLGTLHSERLPQQLFDLVFDKDFQLSHNWKHGSVYFYGYKADQPFGNDEESDDFESEEEEGDVLPLPVRNGKQEAKKEEKPAVGAEKTDTAKASTAGKQKVQIVEPAKETKSDSDDSDDSDDAMSDDSDSEEEDEEDSSDDDKEDSDSDEEEETPKKQQSGKKRPNESMKTPVADKKAKNATPQKTDGKKGGGHVDTPHPSKRPSKTPENKSNQKTPASDGAHTCKSCNKHFKSENALQSHNQAKHK